MNATRLTELQLEDAVTVSGRRDQEVTLAIMHALERDTEVSQRSLAVQAGIALGLVNAYLKRCVVKGLVKIQQIPPGRYRYYLTPKGFAEKSRLTSEFLNSSFDFFRRARRQCGARMDECAERGWSRLALYGKGELAEVAILSAREREITVVAIIDPLHEGERFFDLRISATIPSPGSYDAILLTDLKDPQSSYAALANAVETRRLFWPEMLHIRHSEQNPGEAS